MVRIQINEFVLGQGRVPRFETVTKNEAEKRCKYANVFIVKNEIK